jgi:predicted KAP-like P-loop ATPase
MYIGSLYHGCQVVTGQVVKDQQHTIGTTADQQDGNNVNVGPSVPSFLASGQHILANLSNMEKALFDKETTLTHTLAEIQHMKEEEMEKDNQIAYLIEKTKQELQARATKMRQLKQTKC